MKPVEFENGAVQIDAAIVAEGLGLALPRLQRADAGGQDHEPRRARDRCGLWPASPDLLLRSTGDFASWSTTTGAIIQRSARRFRRFAAAEISAQARRMRPRGVRRAPRWNPAPARQSESSRPSAALRPALCGDRRGRCRSMLAIQRLAGLTSWPTLPLTFERLALGEPPFSLSAFFAFRSAFSFSFALASAFSRPAFRPSSAPSARPWP